MPFCFIAILFMPFCFIAPKTLNCVAFQSLDFEGAYRIVAPQIFGEVGWHIFLFFMFLFIILLVFVLCGVFSMLPVSLVCPFLF